MTQMGDMGTQQRTYDDPDHVHAVTTAASSSYDYDPNGNMVHSDPYDFEYDYDAENHLVSGPLSWDWRVFYTYDGQGKLVKRDQVFYGQHFVTVYIGGIYERTFQNDSPIGNVKYYSAFGRRIAMRVGSSIDPLNPGYLYFLLADNLGSTNTVLTSNGAVYQDVRYWPYGRVRRESGVERTDKLFTGQQEEMGAPDFGLYYYGARFYSTTLGRFISADPIVQAPFNPQNLDRYAYVLNNPLRYVDPTGTMWDSNCRLFDNCQLDRVAFAEWRWSIIAAGVPSDAVPSSMHLIAGLADGSISPFGPATYIGQGRGAYGANVPVDIQDEGGSVYTGGRDHFEGTIYARVSVTLPPEDIVNLLGGGTGEIRLFHRYEPLERVVALNVTVVFSNGQRVPAEYRYNYPGNGCDVGVYQLYTYEYKPEYGYPVALEVRPRPVGNVDWEIGFPVDELTGWVMLWYSFPDIPLVPVSQTGNWP
jgi:RHS repeat-associated protein